MRNDSEIDRFPFVDEKRSAYPADRFLYRGESFKQDSFLYRIRHQLDQIRHLIRQRHKRFSGKHPHKSDAKNDQSKTFSIGLYGFKDGRTVFKAAVYQSVKDINCHRPPSQIGIRTFLRRQYEHKYVHQKKRDCVTDQADHRAFQISLLHIRIGIPSIKNIPCQTTVYLVCKKETHKSDQQSQRPCIPSPCSVFFQLSAVKVKPGQKKRKEKHNTRNRKKISKLRISDQQSTDYRHCQMMRDFLNERRCDPLKMLPQLRLAADLNRAILRFRSENFKKDIARNLPSI